MEHAMAPRHPETWSSKIGIIFRSDVERTRSTSLSHNSSGTRIELGWSQLWNTPWPLVILRPGAPKSESSSDLMLREPDRHRSATTAPAQGLSLVGVSYGTRHGPSSS